LLYSFLGLVLDIGHSDFVIRHSLAGPKPAREAPAAPSGSRHTPCAVRLRE